MKTATKKQLVCCMAKLMRPTHCKLYWSGLKGEVEWPKPSGPIKVAIHLLILKPRIFDNQVMLVIQLMCQLLIIRKIPLCNYEPHCQNGSSRYVWAWCHNYRLMLSKFEGKKCWNTHGISIQIISCSILYLAMFDLLWQCCHWLAIKLLLYW